MTFGSHISCLIVSDAKGNKNYYYDTVDALKRTNLWHDRHEWEKLGYTFEIE